MNRTYLRYECADSFGSLCSGNSVVESIDVAFLPSDANHNNVIMPSLSNLAVLDLRTGTCNRVTQACVHIAHIAHIAHVANLYICIYYLCQDEQPFLFLFVTSVF